MRGILVATISLMIPAFSLAAPIEKLYYLGEVKLSSPVGAAMGAQVIMVEKVLDRDKSLITERATVVEASGKVQEFTMRMIVKEDGTFTLTDEAKQIEGSGTLFGPPWKWTYFKATFKASNGIMIEDENFLADDTVATARKRILGPDKKVIMFIDTSLKAITPKTYEILNTGLLKK